MFEFISLYWNKSMARNPVSAHPLSATSSVDYTSQRGSSELPRKETSDVTVNTVGVEHHAGQEMSALRSREQSRSRRNTPAPTGGRTVTTEVAAKPAEQPAVRAPIATRPRGYSTTSAGRRGTPTPSITSASASAFPSTSASAFASTYASASASTTTFTSTSTSASSTPTLAGTATPNPLLKRSDSNRLFDASERRELHPYRKRRNTEDEALRSSLAEKEKENSTLKQQLYNTRNEFGEAIKKHGLIQHRIQSLLDEKSKVLTQLQAAQKEAAEKERAAEKKITELEAANRRKDDELRMAQVRLRASEEKQQNLSKLLEVRTADLNGVQPFLTTADTYSGAEIIAMVETLNAEIFQTAAYMAELIEDESMAATTYERHKNVERNGQLMETQLRRDLGEELWLYFQKKHTDIRAEPLPLQLAFQCILSRWSAWKIRSFLVGNFGDALGKVYQMIRESEAQAVAGRWRALTNAKMSSFKDDIPANVVVDVLMNMLFFCGWSASGEKSKKALLLMQQMVFNIEKMATQIKIATKEGITTADLEVFVVNSGAMLGDGMEDIYSDIMSGDANPFEANKRVLCTVGIGLRRTTVKITEGRTPEYKEEILLKPKIALASVLDSTQDGTESIRGKI